MAKEKKFYVIGGLWFDSVNGNTYHNAKIINENGDIFYSGYSYGYGSAYLSSAEATIKSMKIKSFKIINCGYFYLKKSQIKNNLF